MLILLAECEPIPVNDDCAIYRGDTDPQPGWSYWQPAQTECSDEDEVPALIVTQSPVADKTTAQVNVLPLNTTTAALPSAQVPAAPAVESTAALLLEQVDEFEPPALQ